MKHGVKTALRAASLVLLVMAFAGSFAAQQAAPGPDASALTRHLRWRSIGPANMVGRISDFEALDSDFTQVLLGSASGGVFKSVNAGTTWEPIFDRYGSASIGDVAFFQKDPNIIWVGTGEECVRNSVAWGDGVYKSTDGGKTFARMGLETTQTIARVLTHPTDPEHRLRRRLGPPLGLHRRPRPVQDDRRRGHLDQARRRPAERRQDRGHRPGHAPDRSPDPLRRLLAAPAPTLALRLRRAERRHLQDDRRRRDLDQAHPGTCRPASSAASAWPSPARTPRSSRPSSSTASSRRRRPARAPTRSPIPTTPT